MGKVWKHLLLEEEELCFTWKLERYFSWVFSRDSCDLGLRTQYSNTPKCLECLSDIPRVITLRRELLGKLLMGGLSEQKWVAEAEGLARLEAKAGVSSAGSRKPALRILLSAKGRGGVKYHGLKTWKQRMGWGTLRNTRITHKLLICGWSLWCKRYFPVLFFKSAWWSLRCWRKDTADRLMSEGWKEDDMSATQTLVSVSDWLWVWKCQNWASAEMLREVWC